MSIHKIAPIRSEGSPSRCEKTRTKERPSVESQRRRDRVRSRKRRARAIVRRAHSALPLTRQREREIKGHVGDRVSDVVRRVAREFGKEVHNLFGKSPMCFEPKWDKVVSRSCALRRYLLFLTLHRACIAESALARVCKSFEGAQGLTTVTSVSRGLGWK